VDVEDVNLGRVQIKWAHFTIEEEKKRGLKERKLSQ
jgi:hypothetical protein